MQTGQYKGNENKMLKEAVDLANIYSKIVENIPP